jgi:WD40 repeat protein
MGLPFSFCVRVFSESPPSQRSLLSISRISNTLLTAGRDNVLNLWDLKKYSHIKTYPVYEVSFLIFLLSSFLFTLRFFVSLRQALEGAVLLPPGCNFPDSSIPNTKDRYFVTGGDKGVLHFRNASSLSLVHSISLVPELSQQVLACFFGFLVRLLILSLLSSYCFASSNLPRKKMMRRKKRKISAKCKS